MTIYYIGVLRNNEKPAVQLSAELDMSSFSMFTREKWREFIVMFAYIAAERTRGDTRQKVLSEKETSEYAYHASSRKGGLCAVAVTDSNYNERVAQAMLTKVLQAFEAKYPKSAYQDLQSQPRGTPAPLPLPELQEYITKYQRPEDIDPILQMQVELEETTQILYKSVDQLLERGEKLDSLVAKSDQLSSQSKMFYTQAKKQNSCCTVM